MADTREHQAQNGNGNGKMRDLIMWLLGLAIPILVMAMAALYANTAAHGERIKGCEVQSTAQGKQLDEIQSDVKEILRSLRK